MQVGAILSTIIYIAASSLLVPVLFLLVCFLALTLVFAGSFLAEWAGRARLVRIPALELPGRLAEGTCHAGLSARVRGYVLVLDQALGAGAGEIEIENLLGEQILAAWKTLDTYKILVRLGPALGLMGTLIPMSTGLASLGQGDMTRLSGDLVVAFTTTVAGLASGMAAYCMHTAGRRWVEEDVRTMEVATEVLFEKHTERAR
jgi:biopolymer transport protein ExbB/TolQ